MSSVRQLGITGLNEGEKKPMDVDVSGTIQGKKKKVNGRGSFTDTERVKIAQEG